VAGPGEPLDDVVGEMFGVHTIDGTEWALVPGEPPASAVDWQERAGKWEAEAKRWRARAEELNRRLDGRLDRRVYRKARHEIGRLRRRPTA
jgi:hypothetical protein